MRATGGWLLAGAAYFGLTACSSEAERAPPEQAVLDAGAELVELDAGADTAIASYVQPSFCQRDGDDAVRDLFCGDAPPAIDSLLALTRALHFDPYRKSSAYDSYDSYGSYGDDADAAVPQVSDAAVIINLNVALLGHSTALSGNLVSPINPRAILLAEDSVIAFQRGVQRVELATRDRTGQQLNMYLLSFRQRCNDSVGGCLPGDLFTPAIESAWASVLVQSDEDLKNSAQDCRQCHQRGLEQPLLLMRELDGPWTHFFSHNRDDVPIVSAPEALGGDLVRDYRQAKGEESYAGLPIAIVRGTIGLSLESRVNGVQPLLFDGAAIFNERFPQGPDGFLPAVERSASWDLSFQAFKRGEQLALPYFKSRATDPDKQAALGAAYTRYRRGELAADALPDLADIFPDDPQARAEIGLQTEPRASAPEALIQACGSCHNDVLDQSISRARFNIDLARMSESERALAIERIARAPEDVGVMPPPETRQLDAEARDKLRAYLQESTRAPDEDALLKHAAELGMALKRGEVVNSAF